MIHHGLRQRRNVIEQRIDYAIIYHGHCDSHQAHAFQFWDKTKSNLKLTTHQKKVDTNKSTKIRALKFRKKRIFENY